MPEFELYQLLGILLLAAVAVLAGYALRQHMMSRRRHAQVSLRRPSKKSADINIQEESLHDDQDEIFSQLKEGEVRKGVVKNLTNYGAFVDLGGIEGLLRVKDICWKRIRHPSEVLESGQEINVKILGIDRVKMHVSLGRKQLEGSPWERAGDLFPLGTVHTGTVTSVVEYGCFVELDDGIKGLVHSSQIDWLNSKPVISRIVSVGDEVKVKVLDLDYERQRISLGIKQCIDDPWGRAGDLFPLGTVHIGTVTSVVEYGSFVDLGDGIEGLMHRSQMDWLDPDPEPSKIVSVGEEVKVKVLELDCERHRMSLGMKQCRDNPWELLATNHRPGDKIKGVIRSITDFGIFVGLEYGMDGLVHISDVAWDAEDQEKAMEEYKKGQAVEVVLLQSDMARERISLGIKQLMSDPFESFVKDHKLGSRVTGKVEEIFEDKVLVRLSDDMVGELRVSEVSMEQSVDDISHIFNIGQEVEVAIKNLDYRYRRVELSTADFEHSKSLESAHTGTTGDMNDSNLALGESGDADAENSEDALAVEKEDGDSRLGADSRA